MSDAGGVAEVAHSVRASGALLGGGAMLVVCLALNLAWLMGSVGLLGAALVLSGGAAADSLSWLVLSDRRSADGLTGSGLLAVLSSLTWSVLGGLGSSNSLDVAWLVRNLRGAESMSLGLILRSLAWLVLGGLRSANSLSLSLLNVLRRLAWLILGRSDRLTLNVERGLGRLVLGGSLGGGGVSLTVLGGLAWLVAGSCGVDAGRYWLSDGASNLAGDGLSVRLLRLDA